MKASFAGWKTPLLLGRVSNLPTVWSNLFAGWFLVGESPFSISLVPLLLGGSFLYIGGMYLNDFCDVRFDAQHRIERPIPAGLISRRAVGWCAGLWLAAGLFFTAGLGWCATLVSLLLLACIVLYDLIHKKVSWAPWIMGMCRCLLYLLAAAGATRGMIPLRVILAGGALGIYVAGITWLARGESRPQARSPGSLLLLLIPVFVALPDVTVRTWPAVLTSLLLFFFWLGFLLVPLWRGTNRSLGRVVSGLLAGIVLVDVIALAPHLGLRFLWFVPLFGLALLLQRVIPAT